MALQQLKSERTESDRKSLKKIKNHKQDLQQESRNAGLKKFDVIGKSLSFVDLEWMSTLRRRQFTWASLTDHPFYGDLQYWEHAAEGFNRDAFAAGFFERARESWNFETEEYEAPRTRNRSIYYALPEITPFFIEIDLIIDHWATYEHRRTWSIYLGQSGGDFRLHQLAEWRLNQLRKFVGPDRVAAIAEAVEERQAAATPTLSRVFKEGTRREREIAHAVAEQIGCDEVAIERALKDKLDLDPSHEEQIALCEYWEEQEHQRRWNAFFNVGADSDWGFAAHRQDKILELIGEDEFNKVSERVYERRRKVHPEVWRIVFEEGTDDEEELLLRIYREERAKHHAGKCDCKGAHNIDLEHLEETLKAALENTATNGTPRQLRAGKPEVERG